MRNLDRLLKNKKIDYTKLTKYGFVLEDNKYIYKTQIHDKQFEVIVIMSEQKNKSKLIEIDTGEEYIPVDIIDSTGQFVGRLREEYEHLLNDIINKCTNPNIFKSDQTKEIINYIKDKYRDDLEFLWEKFDNNAIWRNKQNDKWYGILLTISKRKLGINSDEIVEIIDLRYQKENIEDIINNENIFPGYHMNKKSWITIKMDNSMETQEIFKLIDNSYNLSVGNKSSLSNMEMKVLEYLTTIPKGKVVTYKQVAEYLGNKGLARVVGNILHKNPDGDKYPCYKVLNSKGELAEAFVFGGKRVQKERLEKDGIKVINDKVDLNIYQWKTNSN